ncbi:hypothetical protein [Azospirillum doebereinerae]
MKQKPIKQHFRNQHCLNYSINLENFLLLQITTRMIKKYCLFL